MGARKETGVENGHGSPEESLRGTPCVGEKRKVWGRDRRDKDKYDGSVP